MVPSMGPSYIQYVTASRNDGGMSSYCTMFGSLERLTDVVTKGIFACAMIVLNQ